MLTEEKRQQLDSIVSQMTANGENDDTVQFVVNDFKNKYSTEEPQESFLEKTSKVLDMFFGGGKVGELIGTQAAKTGITGLSEEERMAVTAAPSAREIAGSALQSAALFTPVGTMAKGITVGAKGLGLIKGASALGKIGSGILSGELFDIASNLQQGKTGKEALTPGIGALIGGGIPALGVVKNITVRFGETQAPRVINSLIKPLARDFSYGKNPGRAVAEEGIVANNFDDLIDKIRISRQRVGQTIGSVANELSEKPLLNIESALNPLDEATKVAAKQNNSALLNRLNNVKRAITDVLEPVIDDAGNLEIKSVGRRNLDTLTFEETRKILSEIGDMTQFTGNPSDDKLVNSALKKVYGKIKETSLKYAEAVNPKIAKEFSKLTEKYADLHSAEIAAKYRDKIVERQNLIGFSPRNVGIASGLITAIATGGATIPSVAVGITGAVLDQLAGTPGFKTRLAYMLSKKTQREASYLFRKIPALAKMFSTEKGIFPGDILLGEHKEVLSKKIGEFIEKPKIGLTIEDVSKIRGAKGMTADDIMSKYPDIQLKRDVPATDVYGNKVKVPEGEVLTPYELRGNKVLLQDGETYVVSKNQFQNIKGNAISGEAKPFAPELVGTEETVKSEKVKKELLTYKEWYKKYGGTREEYNSVIERAKKSELYPEAKYTQYQLPNGKNYKEILIKAPRIKAGMQGYVETGVAPEFKSSHWDEPNVISHLRMNERTYQGKKVAFMEELQSDWAREVRTGKDVPQNPLLKNWQELSIKRALKEAVDTGAEYFSWINGEQTSARYNLTTHLENVKWNKLNIGEGVERKNIIIQPKDKVGEMIVVVDKNGLIVSGEKNTPSSWDGKKLDEVLGKGLADKIMEKESGTLSGEGLRFGGEWANNLYDKQVGNIVSDLTGAKVEKLDLGLPVESKTTERFLIPSRGNIPTSILKVEDLRVGREIIKSSGIAELHGQPLESSKYIITEILGDGKVKALSKEKYNRRIEVAKRGFPLHYDNVLYPNKKSLLLHDAQEFDISTKTTIQQGIKLTPEIKARTRGEAPKFK